MAARTRLLAWVFSCGLWACASHTSQAGLRVEVSLGAGATAKCVQVVVRDSAGAETRSSPVAMTGRQSAVVGVLQGKLPANVTVYALGYADEACTTVASPPERSDEAPAAFTQGKVTTVALTVVPRSGARDDDHDGYISVDTGGDDCNDANPDVHPGAPETACGNHLDDDCNGATDCADPACDAQACGPVTGAVCAAQLCKESACGDGIDNDADGKLDCADPDCAGQPCLNGGTCGNLACQNATTEVGLCDDGEDNDGDALIDCADPDCLAQPCSTGNLCVTGAACDASKQCTGGHPVTCTSAPNGCFLSSGSCNPADGGCVYPPNTGAACDDMNLCTGPDQCDDAGVCSGPAAACPAPTSCLRNTGCLPATGCQFMVATGTSCDDGNPCTGTDTCLADAGCAGVNAPCPAPECQLALGCSLDAGCLFGPGDAGVGCDGGVCNGAGGCIPLFPYLPSNFTEAQLPTPAGAVVLDCGATQVNTSSSDGGVTFTNWCGAPPAWTLVAQSAGPDAVLISAAGFTLAADGGLSVTGDRPLIIASTRGIDVIGTLTTHAAAQACAGAGAGGNVSSDHGAGGGGFGTAGADGGNTGAAGGLASAATDLVPLRGGCPGGGRNGLGGAGGGAIQLSAAQNLAVTGTITAPGRAGSGGSAGNGAAAGGSGGGVLLEGLTVLTGPASSIAANGGSGGEGGGYLVGGSDGNDGNATATPASGGGGSSTGGTGGDGAAGSTAATAGHDGTNGGGGGGGLGRIQLNAIAGCSLGGGVLSGARASHTPDAGCD